MKKFIFSTLIVLVSFSLLSGCSFMEEDTATAFVLENNSNSLVVFVLNENEEKVELYDLYLSSGCPEYIIANDLLVIETNTSYQISVNDVVNGKLSLDDGSEEEFDDCKIVSAIKSKGNYGMGIFMGINERKFVAQAMDEQNYIIELGNNCLSSIDASYYFTILKQSFSDNLIKSDQLLYAISFNLDSDASQMIKTNILNNCQINQLTKVEEASADYLSANQAKRTILIDDNKFDKNVEVTVDQDCQLFAKAEYDTGNIFYLDDSTNDPNKAEAILFSYYIGQEAEADSETLDLSGNFLSEFKIEMEACEVQSAKLVETSAAPEVEDDYYNYDNESDLYRRPSVVLTPDLDKGYDGLWGRRVHTNRPSPQTMIGNLVKGETDPATYIVDIDGRLRWVKTEEVARRLYGDYWDHKIIWFSDAIIYTYEFGEPIER